MKVSRGHPGGGRGEACGESECRHLRNLQCYIHLLTDIDAWKWFGCLIARVLNIMQKMIIFDWNEPPANEPPLSCMSHL